MWLATPDPHCGRSYEAAKLAEELPDRLRAWRNADRWPETRYLCDSPCRADSPSRRHLSWSSRVGSGLEGNVLGIAFAAPGSEQSTRQVGGLGPIFRIWWLIP